MCPCLTLYVDRVLGHQSFGVRFQCSVCRSSWHLCWTWRGEKRKKMNFTAAEHRVPETKQYSRQGRARSVARKHARLFFFCGSEGLFFFFRLIIIIRCREDLEAGARRVKAYLGKYVIDVIDYTSRALLNQYKIKTLSCACPLQPARIGLHVQRIFKPRPSTECAFTWVGCGRGARVWPRVSRSENKRLHELTTCLCGCGYLRYACARDTQFLPWKCEYLVPLTPSNKDVNMMTARGRVLHSRCAYRVCFFFSFYVKPWFPCVFVANDQT